MPAPISNFFPLVGDPLIDAITNGSGWILDNNRTLNWSISDGFNEEFWISPLDTAQEIGGVLEVFSFYADINFQFSGYYENPIVAYSSGSELNFSIDAENVFFSDINQWAIANFPVTSEVVFPKLYSGQEGDIFLNVNSEANSLPSYAPGSAGWFLVLHEVGHALGLKHTHDDGGTGRPTLPEIGIPPEYDVDWFSIMSYQDDAGYDLINFDPATPMALDVAGLQFLYGKNESTNAGDTFFDLSSADYYSTYWDASGNDTISAIGELSGQGWYIELPNTYVESIDEYFGIATLQSGTFAPVELVWLEGDLEDVAGSSGSDTIFGNHLDNSILGFSGADFVSGMAGDDYLDGGQGFDEVSYVGGLEDFSVIYLEDIDTFSIADLNVADGLNEGIDGVTGFESFWFGEAAYTKADIEQFAALQANSPPLANDDVLVVGEDDGPTVVNLLANDFDLDGDALTVGSIDTSATQGLAVLNANGSISYTPNGQFDGLLSGENETDIVTYTLSDSLGATATGTLTITIQGETEPVLNQAPSMPSVAPNGDLPEDSSGGDLAAILSAQDVDGDAVSFQLTNAAGQARSHELFVILGDELRVKAGASLDYETLRAAGELAQSGYVIASDGQAASAPTLFTINVSDAAEVMALGDDGVRFRDTGANETSIDGGDGDDVIFGGGGDDDIRGGAGDDFATGGVGNDLLDGGAGADELRGNAGDDTVRGGDGDDAIYGGGGADMLFGEGGDDVIVGVTGGDQLFGGAGDDRLFGRADDDSLDGGEGNDALTGNAGDDVLSGGEGRDVLLAGGGNDQLEGGGGRDVFVFQNERGADVIRDFEIGADVISFRDRSFGDRGVAFGDLELSQDGLDALVTDRGLVVRLTGVEAADLGQGDFIF